MFILITKEYETQIIKLVNKIGTSDISKIASAFKNIIEKIRENIPEKKRISYGRYSIIKKMGIFIYPLLVEKGIDIPAFSLEIFKNKKYAPFVRSLSVQLLTLYGENIANLAKVLPVIEKAAKDKNWEIRECAAGFVRKLIKKYPDSMHKWYRKMVKSENFMLRRFVSESLRPVAENHWFKKNPDFVFSIIKNLYKESEDYPRTSVGNNLSDWMRIDEGMTLKIVKKLAKQGDKNSYWIAYRACRNLVKKSPILVMDILKTDKYIYKDRKFYRKDFEK